VRKRILIIRGKSQRRATVNTRFIGRGSRGPIYRARQIGPLEGLGKEIWESIDVDQYLQQERDSWDGQKICKARSLV
jgi:hypothetical protein